jgi:hypothetical protein
MPAALESCVASLTAKWKKDPKSRPAPKTKGQKPESQAYAVCTATLKRAGKMSDVQYADALVSLGDGDMAGRMQMLEDMGYDHDEAAELAVKARDAGQDKVVGLGPALLGAALSIRPFIKRQEMATVVEDGEDRFLRIPLMRRGKWRHPVYGVLNFDESFFSSIRKNFDSKTVGQELPIKKSHTPADQPALGWISRMELDDKGRFCVYASPTGDEGVELIKSKRMPYASAEFVFNYRDNEMKVLSLADMEEAGKDDDDGVYQFTDEELQFIEDYDGCIDCGREEDNVSEKTATDVAALSAEEVKALQDQVAQLAVLQETVSNLQTALDEKDSALDAERRRIEELESINERALAAAIVERARNYQDEDGRVHSAVFLNVLEAGLGMRALEFGDETIVELAEDVTVESVREYYTDLLRFLAENQPGSAPAKGSTEGVEDNELSRPEVDEEVGANLWDDETEGF